MCIVLHSKSSHCMSENLPVSYIGVSRFTTICLPSSQTRVNTADFGCRMLDRTTTFAFARALCPERLTVFLSTPPPTQLGGRCALSRRSVDKAEDESVSQFPFRNNGYSSSPTSLCVPDSGLLLMINTMHHSVSRFARLGCGLLAVSG